MALTKQFLKLFYDATGWYSKANNSQKRFMNLGYEGDDDLALDDIDAPNASFIKLYHATVQNVDFEGKSVLEVGCGRGGGAYYMAKYRNAAQMTGIDLSAANVAICNEQNELPNVSFSEADACNFSFDDQQFDVIVNLESSHCYKSKEAFFTCVRKSLKNNGVFAYADLFNKDAVEKSEALLDACGFKIEEKRDITSGVIASIDINSEKQYPFTTKYPYLVPRFVKNINVYKGSDVYKKLETRAVFYLSYTISKKLN